MRWDAVGTSSSGIEGAVGDSQKPEGSRKRTSHIIEIVATKIANRRKSYLIDFSIVIPDFELVLQRLQRSTGSLGGKIRFYETDPNVVAIVAIVAKAPLERNNGGPYPGPQQRVGFPASR